MSQSYNEGRVKQIETPLPKLRGECDRLNDHNEDLNSIARRLRGSLDRMGSSFPEENRPDEKSATGIAAGVPLLSDFSRANDYQGSLISLINSCIDELDKCF